MTIRSTKEKYEDFSVTALLRNDKGGGGRKDSNSDSRFRGNDKGEAGMTGKEARVNFMLTELSNYGSPPAEQQVALR